MRSFATSITNAAWVLTAIGLILVGFHIYEVALGWTILFTLLAVVPLWLSFKLYVDGVDAGDIALSIAGLGPLALLALLLLGTGFFFRHETSVAVDEANRFNSIPNCVGFQTSGCKEEYRGTVVSGVTRPAYDTIEVKEFFHKAFVSTVKIDFTSGPMPNIDEPVKVVYWRGKVAQVRLSDGRTIVTDDDPNQKRGSFKGAEGLSYVVAGFVLLQILVLAVVAVVTRDHSERAQLSTR